MKTFVLSSGSSANCFYVQSGNGENKFLIDCGLSFAKTCEVLSKKNLKVEDLTGIFITHEHADHIAGFKVLFSKLKCNFYMSKGTFEQLKIEESERIKIVKNHDFLSFDNTKVLVVSKPHDAKEAVSFVFEENKKKLGIFTDFGHVTNELLHVMKGIDILFLEANYCENIIRSRRGELNINYLNRLMSDLGHLSLNQTCDILEKIGFEGQKVILSHISENTNSYENSYVKVKNFLNKNNLKIDLKVSFQGSSSDWIE